MVALFLRWYFLEVPPKIKKIWGNYLWFFSRYFMIPDLAQEFLAPWKGMTFAREKRGFDLGDIFSVWLGNIFSSMIGAIIRSVFLVAGIIAEIIVFCFGIIVYIAWPILFLIIPAAFIWGFWLLFFHG